MEGISRRATIQIEALQRRELATHRVFVALLSVQWLAMLALAIGANRDVTDVVSLGALGAAFIVPTLALISYRPHAAYTTQAIAVVQMLCCSLIESATYGKLGMQFYIFVSFGLLALYRDWRLIPTASIVVIGDNLARMYLLADTSANEPWGSWTVVEQIASILAVNVLLITASVRARNEMKDSAARQARLERTNMLVERRIELRTEELQETAERYKTIVEHSEAITFEYDVVARRMLYMSPQASKLFGCTDDELRARSFATRVHPQDRQRLAREVASRLAGRTPWRDPIDLRVIVADGGLAHVRTYLNGRVGGRRVRGLAIDVTHQRTLDAEAHQSQKLEAIGRLSAGIAHELNTPIQFVGDSVTFMSSAFCDIADVLRSHIDLVDSTIEQDPGNARAMEARALVEKMDAEYLVAEAPLAAARALDGVGRVSAIVRSMKFLAHPDGEEMAPINLEEAIRSTLTVARSEYRYVADLALEIEPLPPVTCRVGEISQVILNLVVNAAHAIGDIHQRTGTRGAIEVKARAVGDLVEISVRDSGGGIPPDIQARIFDPFFTTKEVGRGTGQGLALARSMIARHAGQLRFETEVGVGTTFFATLPVDNKSMAIEQAA